MGQITIDQSHQVMATLAVNTDWGEIDFEEAGLQDSIICNAKEAGRQFTAFLKSGARMIAAAFPVFRTIKVGTGPKTADEFRATLKAKGYAISDLANNLLSQPAFVVASQEADVDLVVLTTAKLTGNREGGTTLEVFAGAARLGLYECAPDDGPQLCRQYPNQPLGEWLNLGMDPITSSGGRLSVFSVVHFSTGLSLCANYVHPDEHWSGKKSLWVFRQGKPSSPKAT